MEYIIPIQPNDEKLARLNKELGVDFKSTDWHLNNMLGQIVEQIEKCGGEGGWYVGDHIKVKIEVEYCPEDK